MSVPKPCGYCGEVTDELVSAFVNGNLRPIADHLDHAHPAETARVILELSNRDRQVLLVMLQHREEDAR